MERLWDLINGLKISNSRKNRVFIGLLIIMNILFGILLWFLIQMMEPSGAELLICLVEVMDRGDVDGGSFHYKNCIYM